MAEMENYLKFCKKNMPKMILQSYKNSTFKQKYCKFYILVQKERTWHYPPHEIAKQCYNHNPCYRYENQETWIRKEESDAVGTFVEILV